MTVPPELPTLAGLFVNLRPLVVDDAALTFAWRQGARAALLNQGAQSIEQQSRWISTRPATEYNFIIETKQHRPIGMLSLIGVDRVASVGESARFLIGDEEAAKGLPAAAEAMKLLYQMAFDVLKLQRIWGMVASDNRRMVKWQLYLGMTQEGRLRNHLFINGRHQDAIVLGLLESEYRSGALPRLNSLVGAARLPTTRSNPSE
jgi:RimJ/RimL family protein N-acetyltransferase